MRFNHRDDDYSHGKMDQKGAADFVLCLPDSIQVSLTKSSSFTSSWSHGLPPGVKRRVRLQW